MHIQGKDKYMIQTRCATQGGRIKLPEVHDIDIPDSINANLRTEKTSDETIK